MAPTPSVQATPPPFARSAPGDAAGKHRCAFSSRLHDLGTETRRRDRVPFISAVLIINLVVASVLMSMGTMKLPPVVASLPFKLIFFVLTSSAP
jgi:hypothetical protein